METAIGLVCFILMIVAQVAAVIAVHQSERQTREAKETSYRLPNAAIVALPAL